MANTSREGLMPGSSGEEEVLVVGHPSVVPNLGTLLLTILTLGLFAIYAWAKSSGTSYRITTQRIVVEHGVFSKRMEQIDLYRVVDYVVDRPFGQRILGTGNIVLEAMDKTTPELRITGIRTDVLALYERLRYATEAEKRRRGVRLLDVESQ
jgi:uncharacterized membrane protein YdbT with pleckstrin-like domain